MKLAATGAIYDVPPARTQTLADGIGTFEVLPSPELDALREQALRLLLV